MEIKIQQIQKKETTATTKTEKEEYKTIGEEDKDAYKVTLKNETGQDIVSVSVKLLQRKIIQIVF